MREELDNGLARIKDYIDDMRCSSPFEAQTYSKPMVEELKKKIKNKYNEDVDIVTHFQYKDANTCTVVFR